MMDGSIEGLSDNVDTCEVPMCRRASSATSRTHLLTLAVSFIQPRRHLVSYSRGRRRFRIGNSEWYLKGTSISLPRI